MDVSIIISSFQRPLLLQWNLFSLATQEIPFSFETLVINDGVEDDTEGVCLPYQQKLQLRYVFTGQRNSALVNWRVPGFANNVGAQLANGSILIFCCAEMFHINETIRTLSEPLFTHPKHLSIPVGKDDRDGSFLANVEKNQGRVDATLFQQPFPRLNTKLPFLMGVERAAFFAIGGYDEDFIGLAWDDNDLVDRLQKNGCSYLETDARTIHLYHPRVVIGKGKSPEFLYNKRLYQERSQQIVRNEGRVWGAHFLT